MAATWGYSSIGKCRILCRWVHWISNFHVRVWPGRGSLLSDAVWLGREGGRAGPRPSLVEESQTLALIGWWAQCGPGWHDIWREVSITASLSQSNAVRLVPVKSPQRATAARPIPDIKYSKDWAEFSHCQGIEWLRVIPLSIHNA